MNSEKLVPSKQRGVAVGQTPVTISADATWHTDDFSFDDLWRVVSRRRRVIYASVLVMLSLAAIVSLVMTPRYEARATIEINKENSDLLGLEGVGINASDGLDYNVALETQANVLRSDTLSLQVVEQLELEKRGVAAKPSLTIVKKIRSDLHLEDSVEDHLPLDKAPARQARMLKRFHKNLTTKTISGTRMVEIRYLDSDPQLAAKIVNTLVSDYMEQYFKTRFAATEQASEWLSKQLADLKSQVESSQQKLVDYQKQNGIFGTDEADNIITSKLDELNKQLTAAEANRIIKQAIYQLAKSGHAELVSSLAGTSLATGSTSVGPSPLALIANLRAQEAELKLQYAQAVTKYGPAYPRLAQMQNQIRDIQESIAAENQRLEARAENDYLAALNSERMLRASFEKQKEEANRLNDSAIQYTILKREVESGRDLYEGLLKKLKEAGVLAGLRSTNVTIVDPGRVAAEPAMPNLALNLGLALFLGVVGGTGLAFVVDNLDKTVQTPDQIESMCGLPCLGLIPDTASMRTNGNGTKRLSNSIKLPDPGTISMVAPRSQLAEAYRSLRSAILLSSAEPGTKVILVTSALAQEGKSTTSANTAIVLAQQGARVLLVDADMRRPSLGKKFGVSVAGGLSSLLAGRMSAEQCMGPTPQLPLLWIIPAGPRPPYPAELLGSKRFKELVAQWRSEFDYVVIDSPPVLAVTDATVLTAVADAVVVVIRSGTTRRQSLLRARDTLARASGSITGVLVNAVNMDSPDYYHYYGYGSRYAQGYYNDGATRVQ